MNSVDYEEPFVIELPDGMLVMNGRSDPFKRTDFFYSLDGGYTWSFRRDNSYWSFGKNSMDSSPSGTILTMGRDSRLPNGGASANADYSTAYTIFGYSTTKGQTIKVYPKDSREGAYMYSGVVWHPGIERFISVHSVEKGVRYIGSAEIRAAIWQEVEESSITVASGSYTTELQAALNLAYRAGWTVPSSATLTALNTFLTSAASIIAKLDFLKVFAYNNAALQDFACIDLKNPAGIRATRYAPTNGAYPDYTALGFKPSGANYMEMGWVPSTDNVNYTLNSASIIIDATEAPTLGPEMGLIVGSDNLIFSLFAGYVIINSTEPSSFSIPVKTGLFVGNRSASNLVKAYRNGSEIDSQTTASTAIPVVVPPLGRIKLGAYYSGGLILGANGRYGLMAMGGSLTPTEIADLNTYWTTYKTAIGL